MDKESLSLINRINQGIIKCRGVYSAWAGRHGISYHEMLVLYTIREYGYCTQKQVCDSYILPKQTIHNVISAMRKNEILAYDKAHSKGREKAFILSGKGEAYAADFLKSLDEIENRALETLGRERLRTLTGLLLEFDEALLISLEKEG
ncbi:MAG: MarR family winged helix-turn-helix transcriptional regulator [Eubacteriales bacterium]|nr:MarR family winged helix-turn-helix transcriptional regulator [Eubacteriales bacterium]